MDDEDLAEQADSRKVVTKIELGNADSLQQQYANRLEDAMKLRSDTIGMRSLKNQS